MDWTDKQQEALDDIEAWLKAGSPQVYRLFGFAGTGKTTMLKELTAGRNARIAAYTGKAAHVLRKKGCPGASTIHSMIYTPVNKDMLEAELGTLRRKAHPTIDDHDRMRQIREMLMKPEFQLNEDAFTYDWRGNPLIPPQFIVIDEASMVSEEIATDLLSFGIQILIVADPAQLPPVSENDEEGYFMNEEPDTLLTDIHRQAWDSGIIRMATTVRQGIRLYHDNFGTDAVITGRRGIPSDWFADPKLQLLCGKNATRHQYNNMARKGLGFDSDLPVVGDKLCCLRNNREQGLLNGSLWRVLAVDYGIIDTSSYFEIRVRSDDDPDNEREIDCKVHKRVFLDPDNAYYGWSWGSRTTANEFDFGYALTVHKAQGSEWEKVVLIDENYIFRQKAIRWLYTGITRASKMLTVIR